MAHWTAYVVLLLLSAASLVFVPHVWRRRWGTNSTSSIPNPTPPGGVSWAWWRRPPAPRHGHDNNSTTLYVSEQQPHRDGDALAAGSLEKSGRMHGDVAISLQALTPVRAATFPCHVNPRRATLDGLPFLISP